jgi:hypothetical protein
MGQLLARQHFSTRSKSKSLSNISRAVSIPIDESNSADDSWPGLLTRRRKAREGADLPKIRPSPRSSRLRVRFIEYLIQCGGSPQTVVFRMADGPHSGPYGTTLVFRRVRCADRPEQWPQNFCLVRWTAPPIAAYAPFLTKGMRSQRIVLM